MIYQKRAKVFIELYFKVFRLENFNKKSAVIFVSILLFTLFHYNLFSFDIISPLDICNDDFQSPLLLSEISATNSINNNLNSYNPIKEPIIKHKAIIKKDIKKDSSSKISNFNKIDYKKTRIHSSTISIIDKLGLWRYALFDIQISS